MKTLSDLLSKEYLGVILGTKCLIHVFRNQGDYWNSLCKRNPTTPRFIRPPQEVTEVTCGWCCQNCVDALWKEQNDDDAR